MTGESTSRSARLTTRPRLTPGRLGILGLFIGLLVALVPGLAAAEQVPDPDARFSTADEHDPAPAGSAFSWESGFTGPGLDGSVAAATVWDDGSGPALYVAGLFQTAGAKQVNGIARWNGEDWTPLTGPSGTGVNGAVTALTVFDGDLVVGGQFTHAGGVRTNRIARWDGAEWQPFEAPGGVGVTGERGPGVYALTVHDGALIAGGTFETAGGVPVNHIASWDGVEWAPFAGETAAGIAHSRVPSAAHVRDLMTFGDDLIVGGAFTEAGGEPAANIARWDGEEWTTLGDGVGGAVVTPVSAMAIYDGTLIAGGNFTEAGGATVNRIARWDGGEWTPLPGGTEPGVSGNISTLSVYNGELIVGGTFTEAGGITANRIARWDGAEWAPLPGPSATGVGKSTDSVGVLTVFDGALFVGGLFDHAGGTAANHIARWNGEAWSPLAASSTGLNGAVHAAVIHDGGLVAAGDFTQAGSATANRVARWDGETWSPMGSGLDQFSVYALAVFDGDLVAAGSFVEAGGVTVNRIARWDGESWSPMGGGMNSAVITLLVHDGELIAGGSFTEAGGVAVNRIARWDGESWSPIGDDVTTGTNGPVRALTVFDGDVAAGGAFTEAGGVTVNRVARWDGQAWSAFGGPEDVGVGGQVDALVEYDGALVAAGNFTTAGGVPANRIAQWNGDAWAPLSTGTDNAVTALAVFDGNLVAGGAFLQAGPSRANRIARWDGNEWSPLAGPYGAGADDWVNALLPVDQDGPGWLSGSLVAGGHFVLTGGVANWHVGAYRPHDLTVTPESVDFGEVPTGTTSEPLGVTVENIGDEPATVTEVRAPGGPFAADTSGCGAVPFTVASGDSCVLEVTFSPSDEGPANGTMGITSDARTAPFSVTLRGTGTPPPPVITVEPEELTSTLAVGELETVPLTIANVGEGTLDWQLRPGALTPASDVGLTSHAGDEFAPSPEPTELTHSESADIVAGNTVACGGGFGSTGENHFMRTFTPTEFGIARAFDVSEITFGVEVLSVTAPVTVNLYTLDGPLIFDNLTKIGSTTQTLERQESTLVTIPVTGRVPARATLVVEILPPDLTGQGAFYPASNQDGESAPSYIAAPGCDASEPITYASMNATVHLVMTVTGRLDDGRCDLRGWLAVEPSAGTVAPREAAELDVTLDATGLDTGEYTAHVCITSNDPAAPLVAVPVTLTVDERRDDAS